MSVSWASTLLEKINSILKNIDFYPCKYSHYTLFDMSLSKIWMIVKDRDACHAAVDGVEKSWAWLSYWTTTIVTWDSKWQVLASEAPQPSRVIVLTPLILSTYLIASQLIHFHYSLTEIQISTINSKDNTGFTRTQRRLGK